MEKPSTVSMAIQTGLLMVDKGTHYEDFSLDDHSYTKHASLANKRSVQCQTDNVCLSQGIQCTIKDDLTITEEEMKTDTDAY